MIEDRPTLEEQIAISKLTDEECIKLIVPHDGLRGMDFFIFCHLEWLWHIIHWNWFDPSKD